MKFKLIKHNKKVYSFRKHMKYNKLTVQDAIKEYKEIKTNNEDKDIARKLNIIDTLIYNKIGLKPYDEQYYCALCLLEGKIVEFATGEGKTLAIVIATLLYNMANEKVHIVTVNNYLAQRDYEFAKPLYDTLHITTGLNKRNDKDLYKNEIVYSASEDIVFDYLTGIENPFETVIIDEIDYSVVESANSNFSVNTEYKYKAPEKEYKLAKEIINCFEGSEVKRTTDIFIESLKKELKSDYIYSLGKRSVHITYRGIEKLNRIFNDDNFLQNNSKFYSTLITSLEAKLFYKNGINYIVQNNKVKIINEYNGRAKDNSNYKDELQIAIEIKENLPVLSKTLLSNSISYQIFFGKYKNMIGLSGTVKDARDDFNVIFKKDIVAIPERIKNKRDILPDKTFLTKKDKYNYLVKEIKKNKKQPILIVAEDEKSSVEVQKVLKESKITNNILNNSIELEKEKEIIKKAGNENTILISTNMIGRGTDIYIDSKINKYGGLYVIVLQHYFSKRIDRQIIGRSARQGKKGKAIFLNSLEDSIFKSVNKRKIEIIKNNILNKKQMDKQIDKVIRSTQEELEGGKFIRRKKIYERDYLIEQQRNNLKDYIKGINYTDWNNEAKKMLLESDNNLGISTRNIKKLIVEAENNIKNTDITITKKLFKKLLVEMLNKHWLIHKKIIEDEYINIVKLYEEKEQIYEYKKRCEDYSLKLKQAILIDATNYLANAKLKYKKGA